MTTFDHQIIADPALTIPNAAFRAEIDQLLAETPAPPDCLIEAVAERYFGRMVERDLQEAIKIVRDYSALKLRISEGM